MSNTTVNNALSALSREDLLTLLTQALTEGEVTQAPTTPEATKPKCGRTKSSDGGRCTRNGTQPDGACKTHTGDWDNDTAAAKAKRADEFVTSLRERAQGKGGKADNKALAAAIRAQGAQPNGEVWATAKAALAEGVSIEEAAEYATA